MRFFLKLKPAYALLPLLEFRRVLFRSRTSQQISSTFDRTHRRSTSTGPMRPVEGGRNLLRCTARSGRKAARSYRAPRAGDRKSVVEGKEGSVGGAVSRCERGGRERRTA